MHGPVPEDESESDAPPRSSERALMDDPKL